jgi:hypothetical protein
VLADAKQTWILAGALPVSLAGWVSAFLAPHPFAPASLAVVLPSFLLAAALGDSCFTSGVYLLPLAAAIPYLLASIPLVLGCPWAWWVSALLFAALVAGNAVFFAVVWAQGVEYQGAAYTAVVFALNAFCAFLAGTALFAARRRATGASLAAVHVTLFCWLNWVAFPWLGEMP